jgi:predicted  nucleic acid-binding Zn-ribbon protein
MSIQPTSSSSPLMALSTKKIKKTETYVNEKGYKGYSNYTKLHHNLAQLVTRDVWVEEIIEVEEPQQKPTTKITTTSVAHVKQEQVVQQTEKKLTKQAGIMSFFGTKK